MTLYGMKRCFQTAIGAVYTTNKEGLGCIRREADREYIWLQGIASTIAGSVVVYDVDGTYNTQLITTALGAVPRYIAVATAAIVASSYGWYQIRGYCSAIYAAASCAADVALYTDASTNGGVDDTSSSEHAITGMILATAVGSGAAATTDGYLLYPQTVPNLD